MNTTKELEAMLEVIRKKNATEFISTLNKEFNEQQLENFILILCEYEKFLEENN
jgi:hypothetical protein